MCIVADLHATDLAAEKSPAPFTIGELNQASNCVEATTGARVITTMLARTPVDFLLNYWTTRQATGQSIRLISPAFTVSASLTENGRTSGAEARNIALG